MAKRVYGLIASLIVIASTVCLYILLVDNIFKFPLALLCLSAVVFSELITTILFIAVKNQPRSLLSSAIFAVQTALTIVVSLPFINIFVVSYTGFFIYYLVSIVIAILINLFVFGVSSNVLKSKSEFENAKKKMAITRAVVNSIINSSEGVPFRAQLVKLDDNLRYSDDSVINEIDDAIYNKICILSQEIVSSPENVEQLINEINDLIKQRNFVVKATKSYS